MRHERLKRCRRCRATTPTASVRAQRDSPSLWRCHRGTALDQSIDPTPLTSAAFVRASDLLLHRGGAAETTTWRIAGGSSYGRQWTHLMPSNSNTRHLPLSVAISCRDLATSALGAVAPAILRTCQSCLSPPRELMLSTDAERDCGSCGWETRGWTVLARLGAVWVTAWPRRAGGTR